MSDPVSSQRRELHFKSLDDITADVGKLAMAERDKKLRQLGNWTLGQMCGHLAGWIDYGFDGTPVKFPWLVKMLARPQRKKYIFNPMKPGGRLPRVAGGTLATDPISTEDGIQRLKRACARLKSQIPARKHFIFGQLKHEEWKNIHMRHAELHLSFLRRD